jgi:hypothetical protein
MGVEPFIEQVTLLAQGWNPVKPCIRLPCYNNLGDCAAVSLNGKRGSCVVAGYNFKVLTYPAVW